MNEARDVPSEVIRGLAAAVAILESGLGPDERRAATAELDPLRETLRHYAVTSDFRHRLNAARGAIGTGLNPEGGLAALRDLLAEARKAAGT